MQELLVGPRLASDPKRVARELVHARASLQEIDAFAKQDHTGPTIQDFRLDLTSKGSTAPWNTCAEKIFLAWFKESRKPQSPDEQIVARFRNYVKTITTAFKDTMVSVDTLAAKQELARSVSRRHEVRRLIITPTLEPDVLSSSSADVKRPWGCYVTIRCTTVWLRRSRLSMLAACRTPRTRRTGRCGESRHCSGGLPQSRCGCVLWTRMQKELWELETPFAFAISEAVKKPHALQGAVSNWHRSDVLSLACILLHTHVLGSIASIRDVSGRLK